MSRVYFLVGTVAACCAIAYYSSAITDILPASYHLDIGSYAFPAVQLVLSAVAIVAGAVAFDIVASGLSYSVLAEIGSVAFVRARSYVNRSLNPLAEVQRSGRGTVGLSKF